MERLSSCYFCGAAPDQPLATYRVTDRLATSSAGTAITLCPTCHRKLDALLDETGTGAVAADRSAEQHEPDRDISTTDNDAATPDDTQTPDHDSSSDTLDPNRNAETRSPAGGRTDAGADQTADDPADATPHSTAGESRVPDDVASPAGPSDGHSGNDDYPEDDDQSSETTDSPDDTTSATPRETAPRERETARGRGDPSVSKREYKKVLRLLQNREAAVDRDELEGLATSAYGLTPAECAKILDVAIEQGHVEQRGTRLVLLD